MSGIAGVYNFHARAVDPAPLLVLGDALSERGPDGGDGIIDGTIGMVYRAFHTNAESRRERQPLLARSGHMLCWDGRLDNRDELLPLLENQLRGERIDVSVVLAAYQGWGPNFLSRLIGDFALSLWEPFEKTLMLARDPFGVRPLYYFHNNDEFIWSSTLTSLLALPAISAEVDDEYVAGCLALYPELASTPYRNITAVEPGQLVTVREGQIQARRLWRPAEDDEIGYANDGDYEDHFRQLLREAVSCRLRSDRPIWSEISGGLDSSSSVLMADRIQAGER